MNYAPTLHHLSNGVTVILDPMDSATVRVKVAFKTGSRDESSAESGLTHFAEHMLFKGTKKFPTSRLLADNIEDNSGRANASTGESLLTLYGTIIAENVNVMLDNFADRLQNSLFDTDVLETERGVIADELRRAQDSEERKIIQLVSEKLYSGQTSPFITLGTLENIAKFSRTQMKMFLVRRLSGKNCVICISGKIDNQDMLLAHIERRFGFLPSFDVPNKDVTIPYTPDSVHYDKADKKNIVLSVIMPSKIPFSHDTRRQRIFANAFNSYLSDELFRVLRTENGLVYGINIRSDILSDNTIIRQIETSVAAENLERVAALIAKTASQSIDTITPRDVSRIRARWKLSDSQWLEDNKSRCDRLVARYLDFGVLHDFYDGVAICDHMGVQDVRNVARDYFDGPLSFVTVGPRHDVDLYRVWNENFVAPDKSLMCNMTKDDLCR